MSRTKKTDQSATVHLDEKYNTFLQSVLTLLEESKTNPTVFEYTVNKFGRVLRDSSFWVPVFKYTSGNLRKHGTLNNTAHWLSNELVPAFEMAFRSLPLDRQDQALVEVANHLSDGNNDGVRRWFCSTVRDRLLNFQNRKEHAFQACVTSKECVLNAFLYYSEPIRVVEAIDPLAGYFNLGSTPEENLFRVQDKIKTRIDIDKDIQRWNVHNVHKVMNEKQHNRLIEDTWQNHASVDKIIGTYKNLNMKPTAPQKTVLTEKLLELEFYKIADYYRKDPEFFDQEMVKTRMVELYKKKCEPSPEDVIDMMLGNKPRVRGGFPGLYHPMMFMGPPPWIY